MSSSNTRVKYEKTDIYETLVDEHEVFDSYIDLFVFCASLGYARDEGRQDYEGDSEMLWMHIANNELYRAVAAAIAYQDRDDPEALISPDVQLEVLAKYAAGGAEIAADEFGDIDGDPTDAVMNFIKANQDSQSRTEQNSILDEIRQSFDQTTMELDS